MNKPVELRHVIEGKQPDNTLVKAANLTSKWLAEGRYSADKPPHLVLDPEYGGMFMFANTGSVIPIGYIAQIELAAGVREIGSVIINPEYREQGYGHWLVKSYADLLQHELHPEDTLVAVTHPGSKSLFTDAGFSIVQAEHLHELPVEFLDGVLQANDEERLPLIRYA